MEVRFAPIFICRLYAVYSTAKPMTRLIVMTTLLMTLRDDRAGRFLQRSSNYEVGIMQ
jgi:hypothetical protein